MPLALDWNGTGKVLEYLRALTEGREVTRAEVEAIAQDPGYTRLLRRRRLLIARLSEPRPGYDPEADAAGITPDEFARCLEDHAAGRVWTGHEFLGNLARNFAKARERLAEHVEVFGALRRLEPGALENEVREYLPAPARLDTTVYFLAETHSDAYVFEGDIFVSFFPLKAVDGCLATTAGHLAPVLRHELHHIGVGSVMPGTHLIESGPETAADVALGLLGGLLAEGMATMFFTPLDPARRNEGTPPWGPTAVDLPHHYAALQEILGELLGDDASATGPAAAEIMRRAFLLFFDAYQDRYLPIVYVLGADMCRVVADVFGPKRLVELLLRPQLFLAAYDEAVARCGGHRFPPSLVGAAAAIATKAEAASG
jgi:hypothetical protein